MKTRVVASVGAASALLVAVVLPASAAPTTAPLSAGQPGTIVQGAAACAKLRAFATKLGPESASDYGKCMAGCSNTQQIVSCQSNCTTKSRWPGLVDYSPMRDCLQGLRSATAAECNALLPSARIPHADGTAEVWSPRNECLAKIPVATRPTVVTHGTNRLDCGAQPEKATTATSRACHPRADCIDLRDARRYLCTSCAQDASSFSCVMLAAQRNACSPENLNVDCDAKPVDGTCVETTTSYPREECIARGAPAIVPAQTTPR